MVRTGRKIKEMVIIELALGAHNYRSGTMNAAAGSPVGEQSAHLKAAGFGVRT